MGKELAPSGRKVTLPRRRYLPGESAQPSALGENAITHLMPPTKIRLGMSVPYLGAASGASSVPPGAVAAGGAAEILCISAGVVSRRKLAPKGRILRLFCNWKRLKRNEAPLDSVHSSLSLSLSSSR